MGKSGASFYFQFWNTFFTFFFLKTNSSYIFQGSYLHFSMLLKLVLGTRLTGFHFLNYIGRSENEYEIFKKNKLQSVITNKMYN